MHLILDFQDDKFLLEERKLEKINPDLIEFFDFHKKLEKNGFCMEKLVSFGISEIQKLQDLALRGYITQEAKKEIEERLKSN